MIEYFKVPSTVYGTEPDKILYIRIERNRVLVIGLDDVSGKKEITAGSVDARNDEVIQASSRQGNVSYLWSFVRPTVIAEKEFMVALMS